MPIKNTIPGGAAFRNEGEVDFPKETKVKEVHHH